MLRQRFAGRPRSAPAAAPDLSAAPAAVQGDYEIYAVVCHSGNLQARPEGCAVSRSDMPLSSRPLALALLCGVKQRSCRQQCVEPLPVKETGSVSAMCDAGLLVWRLRAARDARALSSEEPVPWLWGFPCPCTKH